MSTINLYSYRLKNHLTQVQLAKMLGVSKSTISMWETGERKPDIVTLKKISHLFSCTADELLKTITIEEET